MRDVTRRPPHTETTTDTLVYIHMYMRMSLSHLQGEAGGADPEERFQLREGRAEEGVVLPERAAGGPQQAGFHLV